jgi:hypothetical protein
MYLWHSIPIMSGANELTKGFYESDRYTSILYVSSRGLS